MIKIDLHMHSGEDPKDGLNYPATALVDRAAALGFGAIAITLHGRVLDEPRLFDYARQRGVLLIPAVEWTIRRRDVLLYNVTQREVEQVRTFADLRAFKRDRGEAVLVIAPHPYFFKHSLHGWLERSMDAFDAVEYCHFHFSWLNLNRKAERVAARHGKPVVANSDAHNLWMFGRHYTLVDAAPTIPAIFRAIREGRVQFHSPPTTVRECFRMFVSDPVLHRRPGRILRSFPS